MLELLQAIQKALWEKKGIYSSVNINHLDDGFYLNICEIENDSIVAIEQYSSQSNTHDELIKMLEEITG